MKMKLSNVGHLLLVTLLPLFMYSGCSWMRTNGLYQVTPTPTKFQETPGEQLDWWEVAYWFEGSINNNTSPFQDYPRLAIIISPQDAELFRDWLLPNHIKEIQSIDFSKYIIAIIFSGYHGENKHTIEITDVRKINNSVRIYATFKNPADNQPRGQIITSPYYIIKLNKDQLKDIASFSLVVEGKEIDQIISK